MKRAELAFTFLLIPVDYFMVVTAGVIAYFLRFQSFLTGVRPVIYALPFDNYFNIVLLMSIGWIAIFVLSGLYRLAGSRRMIREVSRIFLACSTSTLALIVLIFFRKEELFSSRFIIIAVWGLSILTVVAGRLIIRGLQRFCYSAGIGVHYVALFGAGTIVEKIEQGLKDKKSLGYRVIKRFDSFSDEAKQELQKLIKAKKLDEIVEANPEVSREKILDLLAFCNENHLIFKYAADLFETQASHIATGTIAGVPIMEIKKTPLDGWGAIMKRIFDIIGSLILIIITSPIMILTAIAIKLDSRGPALFSRLENSAPVRRVGQRGELFHYFKFRSMKPDAHHLRDQLKNLNERQDGPLFKIKDDPRITRVGRIIRKLSIDELPEFFLVFKGDMSLVGPRPHLPEEVAKYQARHKQVLTIKPGITGLAQISGRSDLNFDDEVKLDTYYIENWSLLLDLWILIKTPLVVVGRKHAA